MKKGRSSSTLWELAKRDQISSLCPKTAAADSDASAKCSPRTTQGEQAGLHIERQKGTADVLVVDQAQQMPAEN